MDCMIGPIPEYACCKKVQKAEFCICMSFQLSLLLFHQQKADIKSSVEGDIALMRALKSQQKHFLSWQYERSYQKKRPRIALLMDSKHSSPPPPPPPPPLILMILFLVLGRRGGRRARRDILHNGSDVGPDHVDHGRDNRCWNPSVLPLLFQSARKLGFSKSC